MEFIKTFESFYREEFNEMIQRKETYIKRAEYEKNNSEPEYKDQYNSITTKIRNYNINKFDYWDSGYGIFLTPDFEFMQILNSLESILSKPLSQLNKFKIYITVSKDKLNQIDFSDGIPEYIRGIGFGYKVYKLIISKFKYITSDRQSTIKAYNIWYNLMIDKDLYCYTSNEKSGVIDKTINDTMLIVFLDKIRNFDVKMDSELQNKIIKLYGSMDAYKSGK